MRVKSAKLPPDEKTDVPVQSKLVRNTESDSQPASLKGSMGRGKK